MKRRLIVLACAVLAAAGLSAPATAGQGSSLACRDGNPPGSETQLVSWPITFDIELYTGSPVYLQVCYSTTPPGTTQPAVTGGSLWVRPSTGEADCGPEDNTVLAVECYVALNPAGVTVELIPRLQGESAGGRVDIGPGSPSSLVCLRNFRVAFNGTNIVGPVNVGICTP